MLVGADRARLFTDGRYDTMAGREAPDVERTIYLDGVPPLVGEATDGVRRLGFEASHVTWTAWNRLQQATAAAQIELVPTLGVVERLRRVKDGEELVLLRAAQEATDAAFEAVVLAGGLREGMTGIVRVRGDSMEPGLIDRDPALGRASDQFRCSWATAIRVSARCSAIVAS